MRILIMMSGLAMGGGERNVVSVMPLLKQIGVDVVLCTLNKRRDSLLVDDFSVTGITRVDLGAKRMVDFNAWRRFSSLLGERKIDLVHAQDQDTIIYAGLAHRLWKIPTVMTRHVLKEKTQSWRKAFRANLVFWSARSGMNKIIAVSDAVRKEFIGQSGIPGSKIDVIYNGITLEKFGYTEERHTLRNKLGWDARKPVIVVVSVLRPGKGFEVLFDALPGIQARVPDVRIKVVGGGVLEVDLRRQGSVFGDAVEFLGVRKDIPDLLRASNLLVQTSWSEALPTVLIEAAAAALPVVATNVGGTLEIVQEGISGFVVDPGDSDTLARRVVELLSDNALAESMGRAARTRAETAFTLDEQATRLKSLYENVLAGCV